MKKTSTVRFLEILPGAISWLALILPVIFSFSIPIAVSAFVLTFDFYWLYKSFIMGYHLLSGYNHLRHDCRTNWLERLQNLKSEEIILNWREVYQVIILATYREPIETLRSSITAVVGSDFPKNKIIFVLATEGREGIEAVKKAEVLEKEFGDKFYHFLTTKHPDNIPNEVKAKGANVTFAAKRLREFLDSKKIPYENVVVTTADADTRIHPKYLSCLTYRYVTNPNRTHSSFQPIPIYANNIWEVPAFMRILAFGSTFWQIIEATRPWRLINFSTHAMSMRTLIDIDYWALDVVNEDSRQFWRAYFAYNGDHHVTPIFVPVYMDAVLADSYWQTIKNQYLQRRRWAYGIEHFPYVVISSVKNKAIPIFDKSIKVYRLFEGAFSWATASFFIAIIGWIPIWFNPEFQTTVIGYTMPILARWLLGLTWIGLITTAIISLLLLPPRPPHHRKRRFLEMAAQWILTPITAIFFGSIPAIDAQTRLMLGKYLTYWTTPKKYVKSS